MDRKRALSIALILQGCFVSELQFDDASVNDSGAIDSAMADGALADSSGDSAPICAPIPRTDLLIVMDNSNSMDAQQRTFARELPVLIRILTSGDTNGDEIEDFPPIEDLNVGVVTSDLGAGGFEVPSCDARDGEDGILRSSGNTSLDGCLETYPSRFLSLRRERETSPEAFAQDVSCIAVTGTNGCGFEQPLESALKAVTPNSSGIRFTNGSERGHSDGENAGFLRGDSLLALIIVSDEDDCSVADNELFNPFSSTYPGSPNLRCSQYPDAIYPARRYVEGLLATRPDPGLLLFAAIAGIPPSIEAGPGEENDWTAILEHPDMQERESSGEPSLLVPSCSAPGIGNAYPPRRLVSVARDIEAAGARSTVQSICNESYSGAIQTIAGDIADALNTRSSGCE